ncbi:MAG: 16S rRNA (cytosine(1402)-N(4))-methyltransferase RsmH [Tepidisphaeraceae bacterium]
MQLPAPQVPPQAPPHTPPSGHDPVLLDEVLSHLSPQPGQVFIDCTLGRAGHASAIASRLGEAGLFIGIDADPRNLEYAKVRLEGVACRVRLFHANFAEMEEVLAAVSVPLVHGVLADLGISTNQLFDDNYGLSFAQEMPLDMRLDPRLPRTAAHVVNTMREEDLANLLYELAQERFSRRIARKIADARRQAPITTTERLAELVRSAIPLRRGGAPEKIDPATRTFMALRMAVNDELPNLDALLRHTPKHLHPGGRFGVICFHSGEDRRVKQAFRSMEQAGQFALVTKKPVSPSDDETRRNPRSRSAKLRVIEKRS